MKSLNWKLLLFSILITSSAAAYDKEGHQAIERRAYQIFEAMLATADHPDGKAMLDSLKKHSFFAANYPEPHSSYPDLSLERQFAQDRQMYHFMASNEEVIEGAKELDAASQQHRLLLLSLPDCLKMMYYFFRETAESPTQASNAGRGLYVLIHIVEDSYSSEHTTRDSATTDLVTVKGWRLSRLIWPGAALHREPGQYIMRLLHNSDRAYGDKAWWDPKTHALTPLADSAAQAVAHLLVVFYETAKAPSQADSYISDYFARYFAPLGGQVQGRTFCFSNPAEEIDFDFGAKYNSNDKYVTFKYDRFPRNVFMAFGSTGFTTGHPVSSFGIEYQRLQTPGAADNTNSLFKRLPYGFGGSIAELPDYNGNAVSSLQFRGFAKTSLSLPLLITDMEPYAGLNAMPFAGSKRINAMLGSDFSLNIGHDRGFGQKKVTETSRISIGYEHDFSGYPAKNNLVLKIGFNSWQGRVIKTNQVAN